MMPGRVRRAAAQRQRQLMALMCSKHPVSKVNSRPKRRVKKKKKTAKPSPPIIPSVVQTPEAIPRPIARSASEHQLKPRRQASAQRRLAYESKPEAAGNPAAETCHIRRETLRKCRVKIAQARVELEKRRLKAGEVKGTHNHRLFLMAQEVLAQEQLRALVFPSFRLKLRPVSPFLIHFCLGEGCCTFCIPCGGGTVESKGLPVAVRSSASCRR
ncbi:MAG: hypothetical protein MHM6MM_003466 [Cercozoa sp. M6MM]